MMIKKLTLKNFLSHDNTELDFDKGVTVIYGHNGAGKSSIIDAIKYALFGEKRGGSIADLIKRGGEDMEVSLEFDIGPHEYRITRMMSMGKSGIKNRDAILTEDKSILAQTVNSVDGAVSGILGIDKETFLNSVFVEQGEIDSLISRTRAERETTFSKILGLTLLQQYADDLGQLSKDTDMQLNSFSNVTDNIDQLNSQIAEKEGNITELRTKISSMESEKELVKKKLLDAEENRGNIQSALAAMKAVNSTIETRRKNLDQATVRCDRRALDIRNLRVKLDGLAKEIDSDLLGKADAIGDYFSVSDALPAKRQLQNDLTGRINEIEKISSEIKSLEQGYKAYQLLENKLNDLRSRRIELEKAEAKFRSEEKRLQELKLDLERRRNLLSTVSAKLRGQLGLNEITPEAVQKLKETIDGERREVESSIQEIRGNVGKINSELKEIGDNRSLLGSSAKCPLCLQPLTEEHMTRLNSEYKDKEDKLRKSLLDLADSKKKLDERKVFIEGRLGTLNSMDVSNSLLEAKYLTTMETEIKGLEQSLVELRKEHDAFSVHAEEMVETDKKMKNLRYSYDRYRSYEMTLSSANVEDLKKRLSETSEAVSQDEARLQEMELRIDYKPDPNLRQRIREMRAKEKTHTDVKQSLFALTTQQKTDEELIGNIKQEIAQLEGQISGLPELEHKFSEANATYEQVNSEMHRVISEESAMNATVEAEEKGITNLKASIEKLQNDLKSFQSLKDGITMVNKLRACFARDGIQKAIRKDSAVYITNKVREYSSSFNLDFDDVKIDEEMAIEVSQNGNLESIDMLSGGEKVALAIALRLSLATYVMESIKTIVMDEPTTYLDEDRRSNLKDIIQYTFKTDETPIPQMVVVTHHKELGSVADNVFEVTKKNGSSRVMTG